MEHSQAPIGQEQITMAYGILQKYKAGKAALEQRLIQNEQWYKLRHWAYLRRRTPTEQTVEPVSGWLFNAICNKHADAMDNYPSPVLLPREAGDQAEAKSLSAILPVILEQDDFEQTYSDVADDKLKSGTGIYGVFWDRDKAEGQGDISVCCIDPISLFWEPGVCDIQKSRNVFHVELMDRDLLQEAYPFLKDSSGDRGELSRYIYDDTVDTSHKAMVVDWYYKLRRADGGTVLHYCKFTGDQLLYASENDPLLRRRGWYDHGQYPFVFDTLYRVKGSVCGFGFIDVGRSAQEYIDRGNQAVLENLLVSATPRHFIRNDGSINEEEYLDLRKPLIHVDSGLGQDSILPVQVSPLPAVCLQVLNGKVDELKEVTGNRDISTGGTANGVTAASAIAAMQEAGSKLSRDLNKAGYRAYRRVVLLIIELIRQFYSLPRRFRITGNRGGVEFIRYSNGALRGGERGQSPVFDVQVVAQKASPYSKLSQNELALQFFAAGFFDPARAQQALSCLQMMDFETRDLVMERIAAGAGGSGGSGGAVPVDGAGSGAMTMGGGILPGTPAGVAPGASGSAQAVGGAAQSGSAVGQTVNGAAEAANGDAGTAVNAARRTAMTRAAAQRLLRMKNNAALGGGQKKESSITKNARARVANSTAPR